MLKRSNGIICFLLIFSVVSVAGCRTLTDGTPPEKVVEIKISDEDAVTFAEAVNFISTELSIKIFPQKAGDIRIMFRNNREADTVSRRLYSELKMFLPVRSVDSDCDFVIESICRNGENGDKFLQVCLKDKSGGLIWFKQMMIKD